jgi:hypothetical protein
MWAYFSLLASRAGLTEDQAAQALSTSILFAFLTALAQPLIGLSWGRTVPFALGLIAVTAGPALSGLSANPLAVRIAPALGLSGIYLTLPYLYGAATRADHSGRTLVYVGSVFLLVSAVSPLFGGLLGTDSGPSSIFVVAIVSGVITWCAFWAASRGAVSSG